MKVKIEEMGRSSSCLVKLDRHEIRFKTKAEAEVFVKQLEARVNAPHPLPGVRSNEVFSGHS